jgi:hypothetical protein
VDPDTAIVFGSVVSPPATQSGLVVSVSDIETKTKIPYPVALPIADLIFNGAALPAYSQDRLNILAPLVLA